MLEYKPQEELIALIKRQEDAIKARDEENSSLLTTLKDLQSRMGGLIKLQTKLVAALKTAQSAIETSEDREPQMAAALSKIDSALEAAVGAL